MWFGRIQDLNIWKEDSQSNKLLTRAPKKEIKLNDEVIVFYMGEQLLDVEISMLNLSVRSFNCLKRVGWDTIGSILKNIDSERDLLKVRNLGKNSAEEIINSINDYQETIIKSSENNVIIRRHIPNQSTLTSLSSTKRELSELNLSVRSYNCLKRAGYNTVDDLMIAINNGKNLRDIRNLGATSEREILNALNK